MFGLNNCVIRGLLFTILELKTLIDTWYGFLTIVTTSTPESAEIRRCYNLISNFLSIFFTADLVFFSIFQQL